MNSSKGLLFVALACMLSTACVMEVDEPDEGEAIGIVDQDFDSGEKPRDKSGPQHHTVEDGAVASDADTDLFEPLVDPDPVSWKPPPMPGADDSRGAEAADNNADNSND